MSSWRQLSPSAMSVEPPLQLVRTRSRETVDAGDIVGLDLPPQSPVFDFEEFLIESASTRPTVSSSHLSTVVPTDLDGGNPHLLWLGWESPSHSHQEHPLSPFQSNTSSFSPSNTAPGHQESSALGPYCASPLNQSRSFKYQEAANPSPRSSLPTIYVPPQQQMGLFTLAQPIPYQLSPAPYSDYELALSPTGITHDASVDMFGAGKLDDQQLSHHYHGIGRMPYGDSGHGNSQRDQYPAYRHDSVNHPLTQSARADQRRAYVPRRDSSVPPYVADYSLLRSNANANGVFAASAPTPSVLSNLGSFSPSSSPRSLDDHSAARSSPSLPPPSPDIYTPSSPGAQFAAPPSQFSASPPQFKSASPTSTSTLPITFVNQTTQYTSTARSEDVSMASAHGHEGLDSSRLRKRRRVVHTDAEDDSDEMRSNETPLKSDLRPPKQAPSMWQVYFADWLQDHKIRAPHDKLNVAQAAKEAGQLYKTLTAEQREDLKRRVQAEKENRERRLAAWQRTLTPADIKRENKFRAAQRKAGLSRRANIKDPNAPKKPLSAYFMFLARIRSNPVLVQEVFGNETETTRQSVLAAQRWREMSDEEKKPFLTQAEHDKIQYEALRKIYEEEASAKGRGSRSPARKPMIGTGYIVPQQMGTSEDITAAILSARPSISEPDAMRVVAYDPEATITARKSHNRATPMPIFSSTGTIRRRAVRKTARLPGGEGFARSQPRAGDSGVESSESDDEWIPGKSI